MIHWQFHRNEIHTIWYLLLNMFSIAVILMKHIYMYNTTFCLNSQSLAFFFFFYIFLLHLHNSYTLDDYVFFFPPEILAWCCGICVWTYVYCVLCRLLNVSVFASVCVCVCVNECASTNVEPFGNRSPFCDAGQLNSKTQLVSWWCVPPRVWDPNLIPVPDTELNTSDCC